MKNFFHKFLSVLVTFNMTVGSLPLQLEAPIARAAEGEAVQEPVQEDEVLDLDENGNSVLEILDEVRHAGTAPDSCNISDQEPPEQNLQCKDFFAAVCNKNTKAEYIKAASRYNALEIKNLALSMPGDDYKQKRLKQEVLETYFNRFEREDELSRGSFVDRLSPDARAAFEAHAASSVGKSEIRDRMYKDLKGEYEQAGGILSKLKSNLIAHLNEQKTKQQKALKKGQYAESRFLHDSFEKMIRLVHNTTISVERSRDQCVRDQRNVMNVRLKSKGGAFMNKIVICPGALLPSAQANEDYLAGALSKALGHSIDACALDGVRIGKSKIKKEPHRRVWLGGLLEPMRRCFDARVEHTFQVWGPSTTATRRRKPLHKYKGSVAPVPNNEDLYVEGIENAIDNKEVNASASDPATEKFATQNAPYYHCPLSLTADELAGKNKLGFREQGNNAVAQFFANKALSKWINEKKIEIDPSVRSKSLEKKYKKADVLKRALAPFCVAGHNPLSPVPPPKSLINDIVLSDLALREIACANVRPSRRPKPPKSCDEELANGFKLYTSNFKAIGERFAFNGPKMVAKGTTGGRSSSQESTVTPDIEAPTRIDEVQQIGEEPKDQRIAVTPPPVEEPQGDRPVHGNQGPSAPSGADEHGDSVIDAVEQKDVPEGELNRARRGVSGGTGPAAPAGEPDPQDGAGTQTAKEPGSAGRPGAPAPAPATGEGDPQEGGGDSTARDREPKGGPTAPADPASPASPAGETGGAGNPGSPEDPAAPGKQGAPGAPDPQPGTQDDSGDQQVPGAPGTAGKPDKTGKTGTPENPGTADDPAAPATGGDGQAGGGKGAKDGIAGQSGQGGQGDQGNQGEDITLAEESSGESGRDETRTGPGPRQGVSPERPEQPVPPPTQPGRDGGSEGADPVYEDEAEEPSRAKRTPVSKDGSIDLAAMTEDELDDFLADRERARDKAFAELVDDCAKTIEGKYQFPPPRARVKEQCEKSGAVAGDLMRIDLNMLEGDKEWTEPALDSANEFSFKFGCQVRCKCGTGKCKLPEVAYKGDAGKPVLKPRPFNDEQAKKNPKFAKLLKKIHAYDINFLIKKVEPKRFGMAHKGCYLKAPDRNFAGNGETVPQCSGKAATDEVLVSTNPATTVNYVGDLSGSSLTFGCEYRCSCSGKKDCYAEVIYPDANDDFKLADPAAVKLAQEGRSTEPLFYQLKPVGYISLVSGERSAAPSGTRSTAGEQSTDTSADTPVDASADTSRVEPQRGRSGAEAPVLADDFIAYKEIKPLDASTNASHKPFVAVKAAIDKAREAALDNCASDIAKKFPKKGNNKPTLEVQKVLSKNNELYRGQQGVYTVFEKNPIRVRNVGSGLNGAGGTKAKYDLTFACVYDSNKAQNCLKESEDGKYGAFGNFKNCLSVELLNPTGDGLIENADQEIAVMADWPELVGKATAACAVNADKLQPHEVAGSSVCLDKKNSTDGRNQKVGYMNDVHFTRTKGAFTGANVPYLCQMACSCDDPKKASCKAVGASPVKLANKKQTYAALMEAAEPAKHNYYERTSDGKFEVVRPIPKK